MIHDQATIPEESPRATSEARHAVFICSAYRNPELCHRLVRALQHPRIDVFLHVDSAVDPSPFLGPNVRHVPYRLRTGWAAYEMTDAILRWLRWIRKDGYRTYTHISGQCYPVLSPKALVEELDRLDGHMLAMNRRPQDHVWRYEYFHVLSRSGLRGLRDRIAKKFWYRERPIRRLPSGIRWSVGCAMWTLDQASVEWMLGFLDSRPDVERFFRNVFASDESFFASMLASSPFADRIGPATHYIDWSAGGKHPKDLEIDDLPRILESRNWFVRKVLPGISDALLDRLDELKGS